jgi:group I intron endonuclease
MVRDLTNVIGYIYKIISPNGKIYIGQTINKKQRKYHYKSNDFKQQIKLWNNCQKYDWKPVDTFEIIEECLCGPNKEYLNEREQYWIEYYDSFKNGLNCNEGGCGNIGYQFSEETIKKMSDAKIGVKHPNWRNEQKSEYTKGRKHSEESKTKMSLIKRERMNENIKNKISVGLKGNKNGLGNKGNSKKVLCVTNGEIYTSIKEAAIVLNLHDTNIINVCKGIYKQTKGFKFEYYEDNSNF